MKEKVYPSGRAAVREVNPRHANPDRRNPIPCFLLVGRARAGKTTAAEVAESMGYQIGALGDVLRQTIYTLNPIIGWTLKGGYPAFVDQDPEKACAQFMAASVPVRVREIVDEHGWEKAKDVCPEIRRLLQAQGNEVMRDIVAEQIWAALLLRELRQDPARDMAALTGRFGLAEGKAGLVIPDVRQPSDIRYMVCNRHLRCYLVLIERPSDQGYTLPPELAAHGSEDLAGRLREKDRKIRPILFRVVNSGTLEDYQANCKRMFERLPEHRSLTPENLKELDL